MSDPLYDGYQPVTWDDLRDEDVVYIDNYQHGRFPLADPKLSGPYRVFDVQDRRLYYNKQIGRGERAWTIKHSFMHYPNNLLRKE